MIQQPGIDSSMLSESALRMGDILQYANDKNNQYIEDLLNIGNQMNRQSAAESGLGENINSYA